MNEQRQQAYIELLDRLMGCDSEEEIENLFSANSDLVDSGLVQLLDQVADVQSFKGNHHIANPVRKLAEKLTLRLHSRQIKIDEQRLKSYVDLINKLLNCSKSEHPEILKANITLVDAGLLQTMEQSAAIFARDGKKEVANWLKSYAAQIGGDRPQNIEQTIRDYQAALEVSTREAFPSEWGQTQMNLGNAYMERIEGERPQNIEQAIRCYEAALQVCTRETDPQMWGNIQNNLGVTYENRIRGEKAENIERAIEYYQAALQVRNRQTFPQNWGETLNNLGVAYLMRIKGDRSENLEQAIRCCSAALEVRSREANSDGWADIQTNLGNAYLNRIGGNRADNLEKAIQYSEAALQVYTREYYPKKWAIIQNNLGTIYGERIRGDRAENIEEAIQCHQGALQVLTREALPLEWAMTQMNLGAAYYDRIRGDEAENQEQALQYLKATLLVYTRSAHLLQWALIQANLSVIYIRRIRGDKAENVEQAFRYSQAALQVRTREADPRSWATTQLILGTAYLYRINGVKSENLKEAIACYQAALKVFTREDLPKDWAIVMGNMGLAYAKLEQTDEAVFCYRSALEIYTPTTFPLNCFQVGKSLGINAFDNRRWAEAIDGYKVAIEAVETSRSWSSTDARRQEILVGAFPVYRDIVQACINNGQLDKALEYVERSRSRRLVDLLASNDLYSSGEIDPEIEKYLQEYESLQQRIDRERAGNNKSSDRQLVEIPTISRSRAALNATQQAIASLEVEKQKLWEQLRRLDPVLAGQIRVSAPNSTAIKQLIDCPTTAILSFYSTYEDTHVFVLRQNQITYHCCPAQGVETLQKLIFQQWVTTYLTNNHEWKSQTHSVFAELARRLQLDNLIAQHLSGIEELIVVPHLYLHLIPFAALPIADDRYLGDKFLIRYAPSCQVLEFCQKRQELDGELNCGIVEDATDDLPCATFEGEQVAQLFNIPARLRLKGRSQATVSNYRQLAKQVQVLLSSHHAQSRLDNPLESKLILGDGSITLGQLMTPGWRLPNLSDVFLSCCETGLGITPITDDILTLATGFLCAGARSVVNTLWAVDDLATALFSIFYHQYRQLGSCRPAALQQAQEELRTLTGKQLSTQYQPHLTELLERKFEAAQAAVDEAEEKLDQYAEGSAEYLAWEQEHEKRSITATRIYNALEGLEFLCREDFPFAHPYYWAAFTCSGLR